MITYKGYTGVFVFEPEDQRFTGHVIDLLDTISFEGESVTELKTSMAQAVDAYLEACALAGADPARPFTGQLRIHLESDLHRRVAVAAASSGVSLNSFIAATLDEATADG